MPTKAPVRPYLIARDETGNFRLTVRETHYNSQGYPWVTSALHAESFPTATAARTFARDEFGAKAGEYAKE